MSNRTRVLKKGDKFKASVIDSGEFTYYATVKEFEDSTDESVLAFKDGTAWVMTEAHIDDDSIPVMVVGDKAVSAFGKKPKVK